MGGFDETKRTNWEDGLRIPPTLLFSAGRAGQVDAEPALRQHAARHPLRPRPHHRGAGAGDRRPRAGGVDRALRGRRLRRRGPLLRATSRPRRWPTGCARCPTASTRARTGSTATVCPTRPSTRCGSASPRWATAPRSTSGAARAPTRTAVNGAWPDIKTALSYALKSLLDPPTPVTSGTLRNVDIVVPPNALFNVGPPMPCQLYFLVVYTMVHAVYRALNPVLGERASATGFTRLPPHGLRHAPRRHRGLAGRLSAGPVDHRAPGARPGTATPTRRSRARSATSWMAASRSTSGRGPVMWMSSDYVARLRRARAPTAAARRSSTTCCGASRPRTRMQMNFHSKRPPAGGGVFGGKAGPTTTGWLFDGEISDGGTTPARAADHATTGDLYREATPFSGVVDPETHEADPDGEHVLVLERPPRRRGRRRARGQRGRRGLGRPLEPRSRAGEARRARRVRHDRGCGPRLRRRHRRRRASPRAAAVDVEATERLRGADRPT